MSTESYSHIAQFDPGEKELVMCLDPYCCYKKRTGVCSLDLSESEVLEENTTNFGYAGTSRYCRELYENFLEKGIQSPVYISQGSCGHYDIADGQHRLCIAKKKGLVAPAHLTEEYDTCNFCVRVKSGILDRIKALFTKRSRINKYFIEK